MKNRHSIISLLSTALFALLLPLSALAQSDVAIEKITSHSNNKPLNSLKTSAKNTHRRIPVHREPREVSNFGSEGRLTPSAGTTTNAGQQTSVGNGATSAGSGFPGASNNDNGSVLGFLIAPPDTDGAVGPNHYVQMINLLTTVYSKNGNILDGPFASNAYWAGMGGNCEPNNQGDPVVVYDETNDRWLVSQFAFPDNQSSFSQCVAISQTGDPMGAYNRYEFPFDNIGFNDYPKHGIVNNSITMSANLFITRHHRTSFGGTYLGVMDKAAMYAGNPANLVGFSIGTSEFGFVAGDLDGGGSSPALFATAMSQSNLFDIWQINIDWANQSNASVSRITSIPVTPFNSSLCSASRGECIPQPGTGATLESLSDRLMHRLQIRDFGSYRTMLASHTVDVGNGRAGIRWYEMRQPAGGSWSLYQEGTYGPNDGEYRWMPSIAMNAAGDIGMGYMLASSNTFVSTAATGQSAAASGSGSFDADELICAAGSGVQTGAARSGDYSATSIDPVTDTFWHTNEVFTSSGNFQWDTFICEFSVGTGGGGNNPPTAAYSSNCTDLACNFTDSSSDSDGTIVSRSWDFGDGASSTATNPAHTFAAGGSYAVALTVTDDGGANNTTSKNITVVDPNVNNPPSASFTSSCTDLNCNFTDTSSDSDGSITAWNWNFGDGSSANTQNPSHSYASAGTYSVSLTVTDNGSATNATSNNVSVSSPAGETLTGSSQNNGSSWTAVVTSSAATLNGSFNGSTASCSANVCTLSGIRKKTSSVNFTSTSGVSIVVFK